MKPVILAALYGLVPGFSKSPVFQPVLYVLPVLLLWMFYRASVSQKHLGRQSLIIVCVFLLFSLLVAQFSAGMPIDFFNEFARLCLPPLVALVCFQVSSSTWRGARMEIQKRAVMRWSLVILTLDCILRIYEPLSTLSFSRYDYKYGGFFYSDSNFNGTIAACLYIFMLDYKFSMRFERRWALLLSLISVSYAVIIGLATVMLWRFFIGARKNARETTLLATIGLAFAPLLIFSSTFFVALLLSNGSFQTKLEIYELVFSHFKSNPDQLWIGLGSGQLRETIGWDSHNIVGLAAEIGIVGSIAVLLMFCLILTISSSLSVFLLSVGSISLFPIAYLTPVFFFALLHANDSKGSYRLWSSN